nr:PREDICTED: B box and SPRY domain-containing protein [Apteryx mantelli mantelli]
MPSGEGGGFAVSLKSCSPWKHSACVWDFKCGNFSCDDSFSPCPQHAEQEIFERTEAAEGILEPQESEKLNFNQKCVQSPLLHRLWASAVLCCIAGSEEIHIDEKTVSPHLTLSEDKRTLTFSPKKAKVYLDCPERFDHWPNALATTAFHTGVCAWRISVEKSRAYKLGVSYSSLQRKGSGNEARLGYNPASWVFSRYDGEFRFLHAGHQQTVELIKSPAELGVLIDFAGGEVLFYDPDSCAILFSHRETFTAPLYPVFAVAHQSISLVH